MKGCAGFIPSIDNLAGNVKDVYSLLVAPIYGQRDPSDKRPIAIIQFINKLEFKPITQFDIVSTKTNQNILFFIIG